MLNAIVYSPLGYNLIVTKIDRSAEEFTNQLIAADYPLLQFERTPEGHYRGENTKADLVLQIMNRSDGSTIVASGSHTKWMARDNLAAVIQLTEAKSDMPWM